MKTIEYKNKWFNPEGKEGLFNPKSFECDIRPRHYKGYKIYHRIRSTQPISSGAHVFDIVKDGVCVSQCAGPNGARQAIDNGIDN